MTADPAAVAAPGVIVTFTGKIVDPLNPDPSTFCIEDIAHALANSCRFTGHVRSFYSVAQHSVLVSELLPPSLRFCGLMHDASEAYLSDIARPVKRQPAFGAFYEQAETKLMLSLGQHFGFAWPPDEIVHWADNVLLRTEQRDLMPDLLRLTGDDYLPYPIFPLPPHLAEEAFLNRYSELTGRPA